MIRLHQNLKQKALDIIDVRSTKDDIKAGNDLNELSQMMQRLKVSSDCISEAENLDKRIQKEYPEIKMLCDAGNTLHTSNTKQTQPSYNNYNEQLIGFLNTDRFGVFASVLLKHNIISAVKDFIEEVY